MTDKIVVISACRDMAEAEKIARSLLESRLAACVNILPGARSLYWWKGAIEEAQECLLIVKSRRELFAQLAEALARTHSYETPEVLALPVIDGAERYLDWMDRELGLRSEPLP